MPPPEKDRRINPDFINNTSSEEFKGLDTNEQLWRLFYQIGQVVKVMSFMDDGLCEMRDACGLNTEFRKDASTHIKKNTRFRHKLVVAMLIGGGILIGLGVINYKVVLGFL